MWSRSASGLAFFVLACLLSGRAEAQSKLYTLSADFNSGTLNNVVDTPLQDELVLGPTPVSKTRLVWVDNYLYGYIVRIDSNTGKQTSRFDSVLVNLNGVPTGARPAQEYCDFATIGNCPGRVAVDTNGDVWIVNRAFGHQGTLSKFSGSINHCIDRNNDGIIETSFDKNGDGVIDVNPAAGEYFGQNDECILTTFPVGPNNVWPRGVAVDKRGKIWVSTFQDGMLYRYNPAAPVLLEATVNIGGNPYSLASGGDYIIASNMGSGGTKRVNITTLAVDSAPCPATYGVVADPAGGVAYLGGWDGSGNVYKADFNANTCTGWATASTYVTAMTLDLGGNIWASGYTNQTLQKFNPAGVLLGSYPMPGANPHGLSVAFDSMIWSVSDGQQCLSQVDPNSGAVLQSVEIGGPGVPARTPYLYSDFTGVQINRQAPYTYVGSWNAVYDSMIPNVPWSKVVWNTEPQGAVPAETSLSVSVRAANSMASLGTASYSVATNATAFPNVSGEFVQVRVDFNGPGFVTPVLSDIAVLGLCLPLSNTCCVQDSNCTTNNLCSVGTCPNPGGACVFTPKPNCCMVDADCNDQNLCTADTCPVPGGQCAHAPVPLCCNSNADCSDLNPCHLDICSGPGGQCSYPPIMGCCNKNSDCTQGNPCSSATCPVPGGFCVGSSVGGCCKMDSDCNDNNACTADTCNVAAMTCSHSAIAGCCNTDADCNSNNVCITDHCSGPGGTCGHTSVPSCCVPNDPNDPMIGMPCDAPVSPNDHPPCKAGGWACTNGVYTCVGAVTPSIPICNGMDNDCSGVVDTTCPMGQACISGQCDIACSGSEFNCPNGGRCINGYCIPPSCTGVVCPAGLTCVQGVCGVDGGAAGPDSGGGPGGGQDGGSSSGDAGSMQGGGMDGGAGVDGSGGGGGPVPTAPYGGTKSKGCGCTVPGATGTPATSGLLLVGLAFAAARARRRRSR